MNLVDVTDQLTNIAQIVRRCPTVTLSRAFVSAYRDFCAQTRSLRTTLAVSTAAGTSQYVLPTDLVLRVVGVFAVSLTDSRGQIGNLHPSDPSGWNRNSGTGRPGSYAYVPHGEIALTATPDAVYNLLVSVVLQPLSEAVTQVPDEPLVKYSTAIEAGALEYLLMIPSQPWSNPAAAEHYGRTFRAGVANCKADTQRMFNTGAQRVRARAFGA